MREPLPGFDPFYAGWIAYDEGGRQAVERLGDSASASALRHHAYTEGGLARVEQTEAPLFMFAADLADPELAVQLCYNYRDSELFASDLRFGVWPDACPVTMREADETVGVHLNVFGGRQVRYGKATEAERAALDVIMFEVEELVLDALSPAYGSNTHRFGKVPTLHGHVVAREQEMDGLIWNKRMQPSLEARRMARSRITETAATPDRLAHIESQVLRTLGRFTTA